MQPFIVITIMQCMQFNERCSWAQSRNKRNPSAMHRPFRCVTFNIFVFVYILKCTLMCETSSLSFPRLEFACSQNWALRVGRFIFRATPHACIWRGRPGKWPARPPALVCTVQLLAQAGSGPIAGLPALTHARARARRPQCVAKHNY